MVSSRGEPLFLHGGIGGCDFRTPLASLASYLLMFYLCSYV